ncbi:hypothetical protein OAG82_04230 [Rubripirellula sp.]|nr:hypothetical protein [Rubripirellula sp.]MDB4622046.1 hypothetical protein [Rubripirellula sp.]
MLFTVRWRCPLAIIGVCFSLFMVTVVRSAMRIECLPDAFEYPLNVSRHLPKAMKSLSPVPPVVENG